MAYWLKSRGNKNDFKLLKQVETSWFEFAEFGVKPIRHKAYQDVISPLVWWERPYRSNGTNRSWKRHRNTQWK